MLRIILACCFLQIFVFNHEIAVATPIVGEATPARVDEFPFIVSLIYSSNIVDIENHFCGGALISKKHVLTAEHCIQGMRPREVLVIVRTVDFNSGQIYKVKTWITYDNWVLSKNRLPQALNNDMAMITLSQNTKNIEPAKISSLPHHEVIGKAVVTAGWGSINEVNHNFPDALLKVNLTVLNTRQIEKNYYKLFKRIKNPEYNFYYTSANPPAILGGGDSGSPLLLANTNEIVGVNHGSGDVKNPQVNPYAMSSHVKLLDEYKEFIEDVKKQ